MNKDFDDFVQTVGREARRRVEQLVHSPLIPCGMVERLEFRKSRESDETWGETETHVIACETGESCSIESSVNMVRVSLCLRWEGPDACILTRCMQSNFFTRLARWSSIDCLRKEPLPGFDVTCIFTPLALGTDVENFFIQQLPLWRQLTKQLRLLQIIEHRRLGVSLFSKFPALSRGISGVIRESEEDSCRAEEQEEDWNSNQTELGEIGRVEDVEDLLVQQMDDQFII